MTNIISASGSRGSDFTYTSFEKIKRFYQFLVRKTEIVATVSIYSDFRVRKSNMQKCAAFTHYCKKNYTSAKRLVFALV